MSKNRLFGFVLFPLGVSVAAGVPAFRNTLPANTGSYVKAVTSSYTFDDMGLRLQFLDENTIRFERKYHDPVRQSYYYLDKNTFLIPERHLYNGVDPRHIRVSRIQEEPYHYRINCDLNNLSIYLNKNASDYHGILIKQNNEIIYNSDDDNASEKTNSGDLPTPGTDEEKEAMSLVDYPRIVVPEKGYNVASSIDNPGFEKTCGFEIQDQRDLYIMVYNKNATKLRSLYNKLAGPAEMVRLATLGAWDSRYYPYNERTVQLEVDNYHKYGLPLDNFVIDTDWRFAVSGTGYNVNTDLFPDMERTLANLHAQNLEVAFNDHPEPVGPGINVLEVPEVANRNYNLQKILKMGLDTWWYDRNWGTRLVSPTQRLNPETGKYEDIIRHETWGQYLFNDVTRQHYQQLAGGGEKYRRPTTMTNLVDINSGNWFGIKDSASHRYSFQWTGDISSRHLPTEINNVIKAGNDGVAYMSSDLGGHTDVGSNYYYSRWIQYGALSPIFRIHCTRDLPIHCQPWYRLVDNDFSKGDPDIVNRFKRSIEMRYRLMPLFYQLANENYETGLPIARALAFNYPDDKKAANINDEWMIGNNILFAPLSKSELCDLTAVSDIETNFARFDKTKQSIPSRDPKDWGTTTKGQKIKSGDLLNFADLTTLFPDDWKKDLDPNFFTMQISGQLKAPKDCTLSVSYDDGAIIKINGNIVADDWRAAPERRKDTTIKLSANQPVNFEAIYFQDAADRVLRFQGRPIDDSKEGEVKNVYLPKGEWYDPFHNEVTISPGGFINDLSYDIDQTPIFIRLGSIIPLVDNAPSTKDIDWRNLYYDIYPSTTLETTDSSYLYEDDHDTTGYQLGEYRKSGYAYHLEETDDARLVIIDLDEANGYFDGDDEVIDRIYNLQIHNLPNGDFAFEKIKGVTIDGVENKDYKKVSPSKQKGMPFGVNKDFASEFTSVRIPRSSVRQAHRVVITFAK